MSIDPHSIPAEKKLEVVYDHYKDTFANLQMYIQKRFVYTLLCIGIIAVFALQISFPADAGDVTTAVLTKQVGNVRIDLRFINIIFSFGLLWTLTLYYQTSLFIERQYSYLKRLEGELSTCLETAKINREGDHYALHYPWLLWAVHRFYTIVFPLSASVAAVIKWRNDANAFAHPLHEIYYWFDMLFLLISVVVSLLYFINRQFNDFQKKG